VPKLRRAGRRARSDAIIYGMIAERRRTQRDHGDLLSMLLSAQDEEAEGAAGRMSDVQVRDEAMTIFLAGHETTANALTWTWYLVSTAPEVEAKLHAEVDGVLQGRLPRVADIASLPFVERVVTESMRLYPPAWLIGRRAIADYELGEYVVPARTILVMSPFVTQRDARFFTNPERFDPERWTPDFRATLPKFAYFPFGGGPRQCIGESFAWMELILLVATIAQRWRLELVPGHPVVRSRRDAAHEARRANDRASTLGKSRSLSGRFLISPATMRADRGTRGDRHGARQAHSRNGPLLRGPCGDRGVLPVALQRDADAVGRPARGARRRPADGAPAVSTRQFRRAGNARRPRAGSRRQRSGAPGVCG
jgi:hypothetical protein